MRQWMINPKYMCNMHLLGEHVEHHMLIGSLKRKIRLDGYVRNNCLQLLSLQERHDTLAKEMLARGMKHNSPLVFERKDLDYLDEKIINAKVDVKRAMLDLMGRCEGCYGQHKIMTKLKDTCGKNI